MKDLYPLLVGALACISLFIQPDRLFGLKLRSSLSVQMYFGFFLFIAGGLALAYQEVPRTLWNVWAEAYIPVALGFHIYAITRPSRSALSRTFYSKILNLELPVEEDHPKH